ncbi:hypothetical protein [uncultured Ruminococcus sp.]|uniref:hypothetical protein n=1 Tax=uncultured Ruminococcus sp. TaxID=165186 RepID=UPI0025F08EB3|nr:hypothetical protein [uncultured Ruminococcus sp.]
MYEYEPHPRRNFLLFCIGVHIVGYIANIICGKLDYDLSGDIPEIMFFLVLPLLALPICYLVFYRRLTGEKDTAVARHFKEIGIWLVTLFPLGMPIYLLIDSDIFEDASFYGEEEAYLIYLVLCSLSVVFVTPLFKLGRKIVRKLTGADMKEVYVHY